MGLHVCSLSSAAKSVSTTRLAGVEDGSCLGRVEQPRVLHYLHKLIEGKRLVRSLIRMKKLIILILIRKSNSALKPMKERGIGEISPM